LFFFCRKEKMEWTKNTSPPTPPVTPNTSPGLHQSTSRCETGPTRGRQLSPPPPHNPFSPHPSGWTQLPSLLMGALGNQTGEKKI
jgi:hypothetical protein